MRNRAAVCWRVTMLLLVLSVSSWGAGNTGSISGVVKDQSGQPVAGAYVKVRNSDRGLILLVISQGQGAFRAANLPPGKYRVQGIAGGFQSDSAAPVEVDGSREVTVNLNLTARQPELPKGMTGDPTVDPMLETEYVKTLPEGEGKKVLVAKCATCHPLKERVYHFRGDRNAWAGQVEAMRGFMKRPYMRRRTESGEVQDVFLKDLTEEETAVLLDYLVKYFGPDAPPPGVPESLQTSHLPRTALAGPAAKYTVLEYALPRGVHPHDVAVDSKGIAWVSEWTGGKIGRFDPASYTYTRIPVPEAKSKTFSLTAIEVDAQDRVWLVDGRNSRLLQYDPKDQKFTTYVIPEPPEGSPIFNTIRFHPDGSVWGSQITGNQIARLDPATKQFRYYPIPSGFQSGNRGGARPYGLTIDGLGKVWFVENAVPKVGRLDPKTGEIAEYEYKVDPTSPLSGQPRKINSRRMATDAEGNVWFGVHVGNRLGKADPRTGQITLFTPPTPDSGPYSVSIDKTRNRVWFSEHLADKIARFDPRTKTFIEYSLPTAGSDVRRIEVDRSRPNRVWFSGLFGDEVGYVEVLE